MIEGDEVRIKINFWIAWLSVNAIGLGLGWPIGELIGRQVADSWGLRYGQVIGMLIYEGFVWVSRGAVLSRVQSYKIFKRLDVIIWVGAELYGWIIGDLINNKDYIMKGSLIGVTEGSFWAAIFGVFTWMILWLIKTQATKPRVKLPVFKAIMASISRIGGSLVIYALFTLLPLLSIEMGDAVAKTNGLLYGMAIAGVTLGAFLGSISGLALISLLRLPIMET